MKHDPEDKCCNCKYAEVYYTDNGLETICSITNIVLDDETLEYCGCDDFESGYNEDI